MQRKKERMTQGDRMREKRKKMRSEAEEQGDRDSDREIGKTDR